MDRREDYSYSSPGPFSIPPTRCSDECLFFLFLVAQSGVIFFSSHVKLWPFFFFQLGRGPGFLSLPGQTCNLRRIAEDSFFLTRLLNAWPFCMVSFTQSRKFFPPSELVILPFFHAKMSSLSSCRFPPLFFPPQDTPLLSLGTTSLCLHARLLSH